MTLSTRFTSVERTLRRIWIDVLGHADFGLNDEFFEIGGDDDAARAMRRLIRQRFGCDIGPDAGGERVTIGALGLILRGSATPVDNRSLVRLRSGRGGERPDLYCFHPLGGSIARYADLVDLLDDRQPIRGVQSIGLAPGYEPDRTIGRMAARYAREIVSATPNRPMVLLGYSLGGTLAFETARRLRGKTRHPVHIVLIDVPPLFTPADPAATAYDALANSALGIGLDVAPLVGLPRDEALTRIRAAAAGRGILPASFGLQRMRKFAEVCEVNGLAANAYRPRYLGGDITLFRASGGPGDLGWSGYVDHVVTHPLDGDHHQIMETEGLAIIARELEDSVLSQGLAHAA